MDEYTASHLAMLPTVASTLKTTVAALIIHGDEWVTEHGKKLAADAFDDVSPSGLAQTRDHLERWGTVVAFLLNEVRTRETT